MSQTLPERRSGATPERWEPLGELEQLTERMRRMLEQTFSGFGCIEAKLTDGVLEVRTPKAEREERHRIEIKS
jgi:hypothetical protein